MRRAKDDRAVHPIRTRTEDADGVFRSSDRGGTWESWNFGLLDRSVLSMAVSPAYAQDEVLFIGTPSGLFRSRNGGRAWREVEFPGESAAILCLAISPDFANDGLLYVGTEAEGLFALKGQEWSPVGACVLEGSVNVVVVSQAIPAQDILLLGTEFLDAVDDQTLHLRAAAQRSQIVFGRNARAFHDDLRI